MDLIILSLLKGRGFSAVGTGAAKLRSILTDGVVAVVVRLFLF